MSFEFKLPDIGEGVVEGEIVGWLVAEGDVVGEDQPLVEVLTDKATVVIPSPKAGTVAKIPWREGDIVPVGDTLVVIATAGGAAVASAPVAAAPAPAPAAPPAPKIAPVAPVAPVAGPAAPSAPPAAGAPAANGDSGRVLAAPATRRIARELGVDIGQVAGTGKNGRITRDDVQRAAAQAAAPAPVAAPPATARAPLPTYTPSAPASGHDERMKLRGIRKLQAEAMVRSKFTAPHFTYVEEVDVTRLYALRKRLRPVAIERGTDLSFLPFIMKGCAIMLRDHKFLNASLDEAAQEIVFHHYYNLGIAVATKHGLAVPVVHAVDQKSILDLSAEVAEKADRARAMKMTKADISGSTFTITSLGKLGGILATPIINPGEVAILGVHRIFDRPVWVDGQWEPRKLMNLSLSFDHRVVDGFTGATAVQTLKALLEDPDRLLLELR